MPNTYLSMPKKRGAEYGSIKFDCIDHNPLDWPTKLGGWGIPVNMMGGKPRGFPPLFPRASLLSRVEGVSLVMGVEGEGSADRASRISCGRGVETGDLSIDVDPATSQSPVDPLLPLAR